jgi:hypothetical protein
MKMDIRKGDIKLLKKLTAALLAGFMIITAFAGCSGQGDITSGATKSEFPVTVNGVTIQKAPASVVVLSPNIADVILKLGKYGTILSGLCFASALCCFIAFMCLFSSNPIFFILGITGWGGLFILIVIMYIIYQINKKDIQS